jgi:hypothetical protein
MCPVNSTCYPRMETPPDAADEARRAYDTAGKAPLGCPEHSPPLRWRTRGTGACDSPAGSHPHTSRSERSSLPARARRPGGCAASRGPCKSSGRQPRTATPRPTHAPHGIGLGMPQSSIVRGVRAHPPCEACGRIQRRKPHKCARRTGRNADWPRRAAPAVLLRTPLARGGPR